MVRLHLGPAGLLHYLCLPVPRLLQVLVVSSHHLGGGVTALHVLLSPLMLVTAMRCHPQQLAFLLHHLGRALGVHLIRALVRGGLFKDVGRSLPPTRRG